jgi:hypothetical protein
MYSIEKREGTEFSLKGLRQTDMEKTEWEFIPYDHNRDFEKINQVILQTDFLPGALVKWAKKEKTHIFTLQNKEKSILGAICAILEMEQGTSRD